MTNVLPGGTERPAVNPGHPKLPVPGEGPLKELAEELRKVRDAAGTPTYKSMALKARVSESSLSQADGGKRVPSRGVVKAYLFACGVTDPNELARFHLLRKAAAARPAEQAGPSGPTASTASTGPDDRPGPPPPAPTPEPSAPTAAAPQGGHGIDRLLASRRGQALAGMAILILSVAGTLLVTNLVGSAGTRTAAMPHPSGSPSASHHPVEALPPHLTLVQLGERALAATDPPSAGRYAYLHQRSWTPDSRPASMTEPYVVTDEQLWWAEDNSSGRRVTTPDAQSDHPGARVVQDFVPGELTNPVEPPAEDPVILAGQLATSGKGASPPAIVVRAVAETYRYRVLRPAQRAAILRVLADTEGLKNEGPQLDRDGRAGIAISVESDNGATRDVLIFASDAGFLLSYERATVPPAGSKTQAPQVTTLRLYLDHSYTDRLG